MPIQWASESDWAHYGPNSWHPFLKAVPSMQLERKRTAIAFHAKDDCAEVRREVFKILLTLDVIVLVAIRRKNALAAEAAEAFNVFGSKTNGARPL